VAEPLEIGDRELRWLAAGDDRPRLHQSAERLFLTLFALEPEAKDDRAARLVPRPVRLLAVPGAVVSAHRGPVAAIDAFADGFTGETTLGVLDPADFLSGIVDEVLAGYFALAEDIERSIDHLDQQALRGGPDVDLLGDLVAVRRRISVVRRTLAPHRSALGALARPEMREEALGEPWSVLPDRLEAALAAVEAQRDALLGTHDIYMARVAQRANDVMKALTLLSAILLPAVVLAGVMGMNFKLPFFDEPGNFFIVVAAMAVFALGLLAVARWRHWW
jgi:magnesium transporter